MLLPTAVDPVNATLRTSGCPLRYDPTGSPSPTTTLRTPLGRPAASNSLATSSASSGACSSGLSTTVLPAARAGAIFPTLTSSGQVTGGGVVYGVGGGGGGGVWWLLSPVPAPRRSRGCGRPAGRPRR